MADRDSPNHSFLGWTCRVTVSLFISVAGIQQEVCRQEEGVVDQLARAQEGEENGGAE